MPRPKRTLAARIGLGFLVAFLLAIPPGYAFLEWTVQPSFCTNCHLMQPYYDSWKGSSHNQVACIECHYEPGVIETLHGKITALNMVLKYFTGEAGTKPFAEVGDNSCMRSGCHSSRLLAGTVKFDLDGISIDFDHTPHLLEMRRSKQLRCTSCHSQMVQGSHISVTPTTCYLCHFKGAAEEPAAGACTTCHDTPAGPVPLGDGGSFLHADYTARGVACETCHRGTTRGTGEVPRARCLSCHGDPASLGAFDDTELLHRRHVTDRSVNCLECHLEITHGLQPRVGEAPASTAILPGPKAADAEGSCDSCHASTHGPAESIYRGTGGRGAPDMPAAMWRARVDCSGCHRTFPGEDRAIRRVSTAREVACLACHGTAVEGMLPGWQASLGGALGTVEAEVTATLAAAEGERRGDLAIRLRDAAHDVALLRADGSRGAHNPVYARALLEAARETAAFARKALDPASVAPAPLFPPAPEGSGSCAACHLGAGTGSWTREDSRFDHALHAGTGFSCTTCHDHAPRGGPGSLHGRMLPTALDCLTCHHEAPASSPASKRDCASCHVDADSFLRGEWTPGEEGPQMMAEVACEACHGEPPVSPVRAQVMESCAMCHEDESYPGMVGEWMADAREWIAAAEARLAKVRPAAREAGGKAEASLAGAERILARARRSGPAHNIPLFEEVKSLFDDEATEAEKGSR